MTTQMMQEITEYQQEVARLERQAQELTIIDDASEEVALLFIAECKRSYSSMEDSRKEKVGPLNEEVKSINDTYRPYTTVLERLWRATDSVRSTYLMKKQAKIDEANRRAIADAAEARRVEEAKAEAARQEAERLRKEAERIAAEEVEREYHAHMAQLENERKQKEAADAVREALKEGGKKAIREAMEREAQAKAEEEERARKDEAIRLEAEAEKARLEKAALKLDTKADSAESKAMMTAPTLTSHESVTASRTLVNGSKVGGRKAVDWCFKNGIPKDGEYSFDDPRVKGIPARYFILDTSKLGRDVKAGVPIDGTLRTEGFATTTRK